MSKFKDDLAFQPRSSQYELLPFRFERLNDKQYVLSNFAGEFLTIPQDKLQQITDKTLLPYDPTYKELRARHFIREPKDTAPLELLALKYRTKLSRLAEFTNLHIFVVTLRCDHSCPYCQVSRQSEDKAAYDMTMEMADRSLDFVFRSPSRAIKIEFQGGEPLLNFDLVEYIVLEAKRRNEAAQKNLAFVIATTLSLLTDDVLSFCKDHDIVLSSSLDGPEDLHNKNRPRPGRDSYQRFTQGLDKARRTLGYDRVSALMTTTEESLPRVKEIIDEYLRHGFREIFLRPLSPYGFALKTKKYRAYDTERWLEFYKEGLEYILELNKHGIPFLESYTATILTKMLTANDPGYVDLMNPAGLGLAAIVFNYDGGVYASDESRMLAEMGDDSFKLGHILKNSYEEIMLSDNLLDALENTFTLSVPMCSDCAFEPYCGAEPVYHHAIYGDQVARKPDSEFCKRNMHIFKYLISKMNEDPQVKQIFLDWANRC